MTTLAMLWESDDPHEVLRERFGFEAPEDLQTWLHEILIRHWNLKPTRISRVLMSDCNALAWFSTGSREYIAKWCVAPGRVERHRALAALVAWLGARNQPVSAPVPTLHGDLTVVHKATTLGLQRVINGALLDATNLAQVHTAGVALARLHAHLAVYPQVKTLEEVVPRIEHVSSRIMAWLDAYPEQAPPAGREVLRRRLREASDLNLPSQLLHGDVRSANVLCRGGEVVAFLDFDEARFGHRVEELALSGVLLGTQYHAWGPVAPQVRAAWKAGYTSSQALNTAELLWYDILELWYSLAMVPRGDDPTGWGAAAHALLD